MSVRYGFFASVLAMLLFGCSPDSLEDGNDWTASSVSELTSTNGLIFNKLESNGLYINGLYINGLYINGLYINGVALKDYAIHQITMNGNSLDATQIAGFKTLFAYMVQCALPDGASVSIPDESGQPAVYNGALGIEPTWATTPLSTTGQWRISSCLMARTNARGEHVLISIRGLGIPVTSAEQTEYKGAEGAFWGNIFSESPTMYACSGSTGGNYQFTIVNPGRFCTANASSCGFTIVGGCNSVCSRQVGSGSAIYQGCSTNTSCPAGQPCTPEIEVTTFLKKTNITVQGLKPPSLRQQRSALANLFRVPFAASVRLANVQTGKEVLRYAVQCAFDPSDSVHAGSTRMTGGFGLAPAWHQRALTSDEQQLMTSCILAHVNQFGARVPITLDAPSLPSSSAALSYDYRDGAFFGDLSTDSLFSCQMNAGRTTSPYSSLRVCDEPGNTCGIQSLGSCEAHCDFEHGRLKSCRAPDGKTYSQLVEVRLPR